MLFTVSSVGWRLQESEEAFEHTDALHSKSHLELNWYADDTGQSLTEVWVSLYLTEQEPIRKLMVYRMDAQTLEWTFAFEGEYTPLTVPLEWTGLDEETGEVTLLNHGVPRNLLDEIGARPAT